MDSNKKFQIKVIENGRLSKDEQRKIVGGDCCDSTYSATCTVYGVKTCYTYTYCSRISTHDPAYSDCPCGPDGSLTTCEGTYSIKV